MAKKGSTNSYSGKNCSKNYSSLKKHRLKFVCLETSQETSNNLKNGRKKIRAPKKTSGKILKACKCKIRGK